VTGSGPREGGPILVGIDFSEGSKSAFSWAVDAARAFDTRLIALHVVHDPAEEPGFYARAGEGGVEELQRVAQKLMDEFLAEAHEQDLQLESLRSVETVVVVGIPETRILEVAEREGASLIVMGGQGRTALSDVLLGSKVERVTRLSPIPVTVVKSEPRKAVPEETP
jgi:nucleotide-binding universal stress UspA family protein